MAITIFAACDYDYFYEHGIAFAKSANKVGHRCLIYIFPNTDKDFKEESKKLINFFTSEFYTQVDNKQTEVKILPLKFMEALEDSKVLDKKSLYASIRFIILNDILFKEYEMFGNSVLVLDIDSVINRKIKISKKINLGLFLREDQNLGSTPYEKMGMKVAAGAVYVTIEALEFTKEISEQLIEIPKKWFCDQLVIYATYTKYKDSFNFINFDNTFLDWDFKNKKAFVFTGKGERKNTDEYKKLRDDITKND